MFQATKMFLTVELEKVYFTIGILRTHNKSVGNLVGSAVLLNSTFKYPLVTINANVSILSRCLHTSTHLALFVITSSPSPRLGSIHMNVQF